MKYKPIFIMGTSSGAGKSIIVTALCRIYREMGIDVVPFKAQNMSLNSGVGLGGEMAYAQIIQARACKIEPRVEMNPVLLKPEKDRTHVVLLGKHIGTMDSMHYMFSQKFDLFEKVISSFEKLNAHDLIIIEGAGSPAEINIKNDIANYKLAKRVKSKNIIVSDIDRGGSFASIVGTLEILGRKSIDGYILNKFRGKEDLLYPAYEIMEKKYGLKHYGTIPYMDIRIPQEDSLWSWREKSGKIMVSVIKLPHIANVTDFNIFYFIDHVGIKYAEKPEDIEKSDIVIIPGSKLTVHDLKFLKREGFDEKIREKSREAIIIGICGGYQMLGKYIIDNVESREGKIEGLNLLDAKTEFLNEKKVGTLNGQIISGPLKGEKINGYEIHMGITESKTPFSLISKENGIETFRYDGSIKDNVFGTYFHDLFSNVSFTQKLLEIASSNKDVDIKVEYNLDKEIDELAKNFRKYIKYEEMLEVLK